MRKHTLANPSFSPLQKTSMPERVCRELAAAIADGRLRAGEDLPGQDELAQQFGVSRSVIREAMRLLEASGVIVVTPSRRARVAVGPAEAVGAGWSTWLAAHREEVVETLAIRRAIERLAAAKAAERASPTALRGLRANVAKLEEAAERGNALAATVAALDTEFHHEVAGVSGSALMVRLIDELAEVVHQSRLAAFSIPDRARQSAREHRAVVDAIASRDGAKAEAAMAAHLDAVIEAVASVELEQDPQ
jgi:GntR family transcriptional repressor for pyruvate dehydrogenase complex